MVEDNLSNLTTFTDCLGKSSERLLHVVERLTLYSSLANTFNEQQSLFRKSPPVALSLLAAKKAREIADNWNRSKDLVINVPYAEIIADAINFDRMIEEIVENAFKFSKPGTKVTVALKTEGAIARFTISDEGRGLSDSEFATAAAFRQFDRDIQEQQGLGIGLAIVKLLAELHDVGLSIDHKSGTGTIIELSFKLLKEVKIVTNGSKAHFSYDNHPPLADANV